MSFTKPGAAVKIRAIPLFNVSSGVTVLGLGQLTVHDVQRISIGQACQVVRPQKERRRHSSL